MKNKKQIEMRLENYYRNLENLRSTDLEHAKRYIIDAIRELGWVLEDEKKWKLQKDKKKDCMN